MYNTNIPDKTELPSNAQLIKATIASLVVSVILLLTCILPAEYAVDPTGIGKQLGLLEMGEIKVQLEREASEEETALLSESPAPVVATLSAQEVQPGVKPEPKVLTSEVPKIETLPSAKRKIQLKPGEAAELKLVMNKNDTVQFKWSVDKGHLNFDTHGDNPKTRYHGYDKGKAYTSDEGSLIAAFDGKHGWFWRNRSKEIVTVSLVVTGEFSAVERVL